MKREKFSTNGALFDGMDLVLYCYNDKKVTLEELFLIQEKGYKRAIEEGYELFKGYRSLLTDINLILSLN